MCYDKDEQINYSSSSLEEFVSGLTTFSEKYPHLQIFMHRPRENDSKPEYEFLMVTPDAFGIVSILDVNYFEGEIIIKLKEKTDGHIGNFRISVNDGKQNALFVSWQDIKNMVHAYSCCNIDDSGLIELEY